MALLILLTLEIQKNSGKQAIFTSGFGDGHLLEVHMSPAKLLLVVAILVGLQESGEAASKRLTAEAIVSLRTIQSFAISPGGESIVYVVSEPLPDAQSKESS
jgi:hypothetical protein